jgi:cytochrome c peroxidase
MKTKFIFSFVYSVSLIIVLITACTKSNNVINTHSAQLNQLQSYTYSTSSKEANLGRVLFYDKNLSLNNTISCGSCHKQQFAFADNHAFSIGATNEYTARNSTALLNTGNTKFWDGRAQNFTDAVFMPVQNHLEMGIYDLNILPTRLSQLGYYDDLFNNAYSKKEITVDKINSALASFLKNFNSTNSKYDLAYTNSTTPSNIFLTAQETEGLNLFNGKAMCGNCHGGTNFNGWSGNYQNIGLDMNYADKGRAKITNYANDDGKFNVPTLKNISVTAPYMHDGRFTTLAEVIEHYSTGIQNHPNLNWVFKSGNNAKQLNLTDPEKKALEVFLNTLTDVSFITDPKFSDPFQ